MSETDSLKYTTSDAIARKLIGRLELSNPAAGSTFAWGNNLGSQSVNPDLLLQIGLQKEAYVDSILAVIYEMPLALTSSITRRILSEIIESLTVAELMRVHYIGSGLGGVGSDISSAATNERIHGEELLKVYTCGHNIQFPGSGNASSPPGMTPSQPVLLPEEVLRSKPIDSITRNYTIVGSKRNTTATALDNIF